MKINELFKDEYIGRRVIDNSEQNEMWIIKENTLYSEILKLSIGEYYTIVYILELEFEFEFVEKKTGWEHVEEDNSIYFIDRGNSFIEIKAFGGSAEESLFENYNYFSTKEKAQEVADFQLELRKTLKHIDTKQYDNATNNKKTLLDLLKEIRQDKEFTIIAEEVK